MGIKKTPPPVNKKQTDFMIDCFLDDRLSGRVIGTETNTGMSRKGIDKEGRVVGEYRATGVRPMFAERFRVYGFELPRDAFEN